jgi:hypothetical protein
MIKITRACLWVFACALISALPAFAQSAAAPVETDPPAHIALVEGQAFLDREGRSEPAVENAPLLDGDRIRTQRGRVEIMLGDQSLLHLDEDTTVDLLAGDLIRVLQGRIDLVVIGARDPSRAVAYQIDAPAASVQTNAPGEYLVTIDEARGEGTTELSVVRGDATLGNDAGSVTVRAGERSTCRVSSAPGRPTYFNSAQFDEFGRWSADRRNSLIGTTSARYLPEDLEPYSGTFDRYGTWRYEASNGYVWFPTVATGWRPYSVGYWREYDRWDAFWIAGDPWGWPTHHYGRWGFSAGFGWYWIPARSWAPSFVYWAAGGDYVSWCPLGWNDYPVFGQWGVRGVYMGSHDSWYGWTVIPRQHFGSAVYASHVAIDGRRLDDRARSLFAAGRRGPVVGHAVPRGSAATATPRTGASLPSGGSRGSAVAGPGDRSQQRLTAPDRTRAETRGQVERAPRTGSPATQASPAPERAVRRTVPGAPTDRSDRVEPARTRPVPEATTPRGSTSGPGRGSAPAAVPRPPARGATPAPIRQQMAPWPSSSVQQPVSRSPRAEPRSWPGQRSAETPSPRIEQRSPAAASPRIDQRSSSRPSGGGPGAGAVYRPPQTPSAAPRSGPSPNRGAPAPSPRYNPGSAPQRSPSQGTPPPQRGRGGAPG